MLDWISGHLSALPPTAAYALCGALGGALGGVLSTVVNNLTGYKWLGSLVFAVAIAAGINLPNVLPVQSSEAQSPDQAMAQLKQNRLFADIFRLHPEAEAQMRDQLAKFDAGSLGADHAVAAQSAAGQIVDRYFYTDLLSASDEAVNKYVAYNFIAMQNLQGSPELCVKYFMGDHRLSRDELSKLHFDDEVNAKAAIIESVSSPTPMKKLTPQEIFAAIGEAYRTFALDRSDLAKLPRLRDLPPQDGCKVATEFSQVLSMMDANVRANVFKNMVAMARH